jgi:hypothetical protein
MEKRWNMLKMVGKWGKLWQMMGLTEAPGLPQTWTRAGTALHHPAAPSRMETPLDMFGDVWRIYTRRRWHGTLRPI